MGANWSTTERQTENTPSYKVVNYRDYAHSISEFMDLYPLISFETSGQAYSPETVGDVGSGHFGTLTFETVNFNKTPYTVYALTCSKNAFWWDVGVYIGFELKIVGEYFVVTPYMNAWIYSGGAVWRYLHFGLAVSNITFLPKNHNNIIAVQV
ncbi:unnamed protein product [Brassicogethes aeneus]|uniref:Uncharacterized protein n=1 Tax=Brassicogethes aeneus TaxID=1431903 RepID=A0A9P0B8V2_BRAAE|nr:unnamed protein product [Brassicogethes aeneus]